MNAIFHRTSIRRYTQEAVSEGQIELMLKAAMAAPSAHNQQPWEYYVVTDKAKIEQLSHSTPYTEFCAEAPLVFVACSRLDSPVPDYVNIDMSASVENLLLEADELGLGACWMGIAPHEDRIDCVNKAIDIKDGLTAFALIAVGHPLKEKQQQDRYDPARVHYIK